MPMPPELEDFLDEIMVFTGEDLSLVTRLMKEYISIDIERRLEGTDPSPHLRTFMEREWAKLSCLCP